MGVFVCICWEKFINGMGGGRTKGRHISDVNGQGYSDCCDGGGGRYSQMENYSVWLNADGQCAK